MIDVDELAQEIRRVDGENSLGAGALAEALLPFIAARRSPVPEGDGLREAEPKRIELDIGAALAALQASPELGQMLNEAVMGKVVADQLAAAYARIVELEAAVASPAPVKAEAEVVAAWAYQTPSGVDAIGEYDNWQWRISLKAMTDAPVGTIRNLQPLRDFDHATPSSGGRREALECVWAERERQKSVEGWTPEHDDTHTKGEMATAAGIYALVAGSADRHWVIQGLSGNDYIEAALRLWPWDRAWLKPTDRRRDLVKAGALIIAEIERLDRALANTNPTGAEE